MLMELLAEEGGPIDPLTAAPENLKAGLWALGIFVVLLFVLRKLAWGPIVNGLHAREARIAESLEKAEEIEKATRELAETNRLVLEKARQEAQGIVTESRAAAQRAAGEVLAKAQAEIEAHRQRFARETELMTAKARDEVRREAADLVVRTAAQLLARTLGPEERRRLVQEALRDVESVARN